MVPINRAGIVRTDIDLDTGLLIEGADIVLDRYITGNATGREIIDRACKIVIHDTAAYIVSAVVNHGIVDDFINPVSKPDTRSVVFINYIVADGAGGMSHIDAAAIAILPIAIDSVFADGEVGVTTRAGVSSAIC